jgi:hypothetical protein
MTDEQPITDLDDIRTELTVLADRLERLPTEAFNERLTIRMRQDELRDWARTLQTNALAGDIMSADQLERRIGMLRERIRQHYGNRLSSSSGPQSGMGGGLDPNQRHERRAPPPGGTSGGDA